MGITGLIQFLKDAQQSGTLSSYRGKIVVVDGYIWLHRSLSTCAHDLAYGIPTNRYVAYCMKRVKLLLDYGVIPIIVFDGAPLPAKKETEMLRQERRLERRAAVMKLMKKRGRSVPRDLLLGCLSVTYEMAHNWILELRSSGIRYVVAPYEADSQMAYYCRKGIASAAVTEDSDLLVFKCSEVLYKLDSDATYTRIRYNDIFKIPGMETMTPDRFIEMCILSGCDYLSSPKRVGIKTAYTMLKNSSASQLFKLWNSALNDQKAPERTPGYEERFEIVKLVFSHQHVYDDEKQIIVNLTPIEDMTTLSDEVLEAIGPYFDPEIAKGVAEGFLNPVTHEPFTHSITIPAQLNFNMVTFTELTQMNNKTCHKKQSRVVKKSFNTSYYHSSLQEPSLPNTESPYSTNDDIHEDVEINLPKYTLSSYFTRLSKLKTDHCVSSNLKKDHCVSSKLKKDHCVSSKLKEDHYVSSYFTELSKLKNDYCMSSEGCACSSNTLNSLVMTNKPVSLLDENSTFGAISASASTNIHIASQSFDEVSENNTLLRNTDPQTVNVQKKLSFSNGRIIHANSYERQRLQNSKITR